MSEQSSLPSCQPSPLLSEKYSQSYQRGETDEEGTRLFVGGRRAFGFDGVDGVKVPREDEQAVIREMVKKRERGIGYRDIAEWMAETQGRKMTFMWVRRTIRESICVDCAKFAASN